VGRFKFFEEAGEINARKSPSNYFPRYVTAVSTNHTDELALPNVYFSQAPAMGFS
jgi:hypothetical protein